MAAGKQAGQALRGLNSLMCLLLCVVLVRATDKSPDQSDVRVQSHRIQELHACTGTSAYIPWPLNIVKRTGHPANVIKLSLRPRHAKEKIDVALYTRNEKLIGLNQYRERLRMSDEHSGVFIKRVSIADGGIFTAQAHSPKGRVWTRSTNLTVHVRPMLKGEELTVKKSELLSPEGGPAKLHCVKLTCGLLEYAGYPPTQYVWQSTSKVLAQETAHDDTESMLEICGPFADRVFCSVGGFSSICTYDYVSYIDIDLPAPFTNTSQVTSAGVTSDLILMVVVPVLAVGIPLIILAVWVLSHVMGDRRRRAWNSRSNHHAEDPDVDDNVLTEQTHNTIGEPSDDDAGDDNGNDNNGDIDTIRLDRGAINGIAPDPARNASPRIMRNADGDRTLRVGTPWRGSHTHCNSISSGRGGGGMESPDSAVKSPFSTLDSRSQGDGSALGPAGGSSPAESFHSPRGNTPNLDNTMPKMRVGFDVDRRDQGEIRRVSDDDDDDEDDEDDGAQPLVEVTLV